MSLNLPEHSISTLIGQNLENGKIDDSINLTKNQVGETLESQNNKYNIKSIYGYGGRIENDV
ncbi:MAG: hypothetical protein Q8K30_01115 [Candidatus Gracilibacteria bacterium]|nr:hypothetical protein [Candidatus Gracilibacteria bacterium]